MRPLRAVPAVAPRAVLYLRQSVSRDDSISIELQETAGRDYCAKQGYDVVAVEVDEGLSGRNWSRRPAVQRVMDMVEARDADVIVLWKWSRLSRNRKDWALAADRIDIAGGRIESATEPIDTATASGRFARGVMTEYAAFQSEQIGEQWAEVHSRRFRLGLPASGPYPFGWESNGDGSIRQHPERAAAVRRAYDMYFQGMGFSRIARELESMGNRSPRGNRWAQASVRTFMDSPIQAGMVEYRGELRDGAHDGIISSDEWALYTSLRESRTITKRQVDSVYLLSGLVICHCGHKRVGVSRQGKDGKLQYYVCPSRDKHASKSIPAPIADAHVGEWMKSLVAQVSDPTFSPTATVDAEIIAREIIAVEKRMVKLTQLLVDGLVPEATYLATRDELAAESDRLRSTHSAAVASSRNTIPAFTAANKDLAETWDHLLIEDRQVIIRQAVESITVNEDKTLSITSAFEGFTP